MSSALFRQIGSGEPADKPERLFLAAISAFCSLRRPSRQEIAQVDDLTLPLFDCVSREARRFAAAALSECEDAPPMLTRRLCDQPVDVCAALLVRSRSLKDIDLIGLIGRHGVAHAHAIARRPNLNSSIVDLIRVLCEAEPEQDQAGAKSVQHGVAEGSPARSSAISSPVAPESPVSAAEAVRSKLRAMMRPADATGSETGALPAWGSCAGAYDKLRSTALTGVPGLFQTALADALGVNLRQARRLATHAGADMLPVALSALGLGAEQAFVVVAAVHPARFGHAEAIRLFLDTFQATDKDEARARLRAWKGDTVAATFEKRLPLSPAAGHATDEAKVRLRLKAS